MGLWARVSLVCTPQWIIPPLPGYQPQHREAGCSTLDSLHPLLQVSFQSLGYMEAHRARPRETWRAQDKLFPKIWGRQWRPQSDPEFNFYLTKILAGKVERSIQSLLLLRASRPRSPRLEATPNAGLASFLGLDPPFRDPNTGSFLLQAAWGSFRCRWVGWGSESTTGRWL